MNTKLEQMLKEWDSDKGKQTEIQASALIRELRVTLAGKEEMINVLLSDKKGCTWPKCRWANPPDNPEKELANINLRGLKAMLAEQLKDGSWNCGPIMFGMANGMILSVAKMEGKEPEYKKMPESWVQSTACVRPDCECMDYCEADDTYSETPAVDTSASSD